MQRNTKKNDTILLAEKVVYWAVMVFLNAKKYGGAITDNFKKLEKDGPAR